MNLADITSVAERVISDVSAYLLGLVDPLS
jgi:hypothetical protein